MNHRLLLVRAFDLPLNTLLRKGLARLGVELKALASRTRANFRSTRTPIAQFRGFKPTRLLDKPIANEIIGNDFAFLRELNDKTLNHEFNLLGSGWVQVRRGIIARGVEGHVYQASRSQDSSLHAIDWHLDFKSGYRWNPAQWWRDIPYGHRPGVDIKVPWELARMQHLPALALEAGTLTSSDTDRARVLMTEARAQILDFISQNSPLFGVNWRCAMDVGIRAANWVLTVDLFRSNGFEFDDDFYEILLASLEDHGCFITKNFEKYPDFRANHYLANISGLAFIAVALPSGHARKESWLQIASAELLKEIEYQFNPDGSNFEASTAYHRLSTEMAVYALAVLRGDAVRCGRSFDVSEVLLDRLAKAGLFSEAITKPCGRFVQIGDNDSGRFFKMPFHFGKIDGELNEQDLNQSDIPPLCKALFGISSKAVSAHLLLGLIRKPFNAPTPISVRAVALDNSESALIANFEKSKHKRDYVFKTAQPIGTLEKFEFPDFGLTILKNSYLFLSFRCGPLGQKGRAGHDHDDQLSIELEIDRKLVVADPGTYLYTALKDRRNEYRSIRAHFAPQLVTGEIADLGAGLFYLRLVKPGHPVLSTERAIAGSCERGTTTVWRLVTIAEDSVRIRDWCDDVELLDLKSVPKVPFSSGYGRRD